MRAVDYALVHLRVTETRSITEPAGALGLAGLKRYIVDNNLIGAQKKFVAVVSGANMNFDRLRFVAERAELGEGREALLSVEIPEKPGRYTLHLFLSRLDELLIRFVQFHPASQSHPSTSDDGIRLSIQ